MTVVPEEATTGRVRISGMVLKGSDVVSAIACRRHGVLEEDVFKSFRQMEDKEPSAVYPLHPRCEVSGLEQREILIRAKGKNTFVAYVAGKYEKIEGYQFSVTWMGHSQGRPSKTVRLVLGFDAETTAARWQTEFLKAIEHMAMLGQEAETPSPMPLPSGSPQSAMTEPIADREVDPNRPFRSFRDEEFHNEYLDHRKSATSYHDAEEGLYRSASFQYSAASAPINTDPGPAIPRLRYYGFWSPWRLTNGLAIYKEDDPSEGIEAFMVSTIVRSTPSTCFHALIESNKDRTSGTTGFLNMEVLEKIDDHVDVVCSRLQLNGNMSSFLAPREILLDRNWRKEEEDGTYIVVMKSVNRTLAENTSSKFEDAGRHFWDPIRAQVLACVFTIAPLQDKYIREGSESPEALLTMVLKIDLGGVLSPLNPMRPLAHFIGFKDATMESILMTVVTLKDRVEHSRFVSLPYIADTSPPPQTQCTLEEARQSLHGWPNNDQQSLSALESDLQPEKESSTAQITHSASLRMPSRVPSKRGESGTCDPIYWMSPGAAGFRVRGPNYLRDKKKILASEPVLKLLAVDLAKLDHPTRHIGRYLDSVQRSPAAFSFVVQIMVPGPPHLALVMTWGSKDESHGMDGTSMSLDEHEPSTEQDHELPPFELALMKFFIGDDETRDNSFKLIPHIVKGSFIIKQSVGSTPVLLGKKLKQYYFKTARYIEVDIDIGSSYTAAAVVSLVSGVTKTLVVDLGIVLEGKTPQELPEALLGTVRLDHLDLTTAVHLKTEDEDNEQTEDNASH